jgi:hypothetical protein
MDLNNYKMDKFFEDAEHTLSKINDASKAVKRASSTLQWLGSIVIVMILGFSVDTRLQVEKKSDKDDLAECQLDMRNTYLTKQDAMLVHGMERDYYMQMLSKDTSIIKNTKYPELINQILQR